MILHDVLLDERYSVLSVVGNIEGRLIIETELDNPVVISTEMTKDGEVKLVLKENR